MGWIPHRRCLLDRHFRRFLLRKSNARSRISSSMREIRRNVERTTMLSENHVLYGDKKLLKRAKLTLYPHRSPALYKWFRARQRAAKRPRWRPRPRPINAALVCDFVPLRAHEMKTPHPIDLLCTDISVTQQCYGWSILWKWIFINRNQSKVEHHISSLAHEYSKIGWICVIVGRC